MNILILEDDDMARMGISILLKNRGTLFEFDQAKQVLGNVDNLNIDMAFVDLDLEEDLVGLEVINVLSSRGIKCIALTGHEEDEIVLRAYEFGATDFLVKPATEESIDYIFSKERFKNISGEQTYLSNDILERLVNINSGDQNILIEGETGTGKTILAKKIHTFISELRDLEENKVPFVEVNCSEISPSLFEAELFGSKKGSFTGASADRMGFVERANGGVLFLDEIGSLTKEIQVKLLKVLDEGKYYQVGDSNQKKSDFILISATCDDVQRLVDEDKMRKDFFHRINDISIMLPSFHTFNNSKKKIVINDICKSFPKRIVISDDALDLIMAHVWEGNIRELKKFLTNLYKLDIGIIDSMMVSKFLKLKPKSKIDLNREIIAQVKEFGLPHVISEIEESMINYFYEENNYKSRQTISDLKISNNLFYKYVKREDS